MHDDDDDDDDDNDDDNDAFFYKPRLARVVNFPRILKQSLV